MADQFIRIGAEFDVSSIIAGSDEASRALDGVARAVQELAVQQGATTTAEERLVEGLQGIVAGERAAAPAIEAEAIAHEDAARGGRSHAEANIQARLTTDLLTGNVSRAENALIRFASHSEVLGPLMQAAFAPFAIIVFVDILEHAYEAIQKLTNAVMGYTKEVEAAEKATAKMSEEARSDVGSLIEANEKLHDIIMEIGTAAGQSYGERFANAAGEAERSTSEWLSVIPGLRGLITTYEALSKAESDAANQAVRDAAVQENIIIGKMRLTEEQARDAVKLIDLQVQAQNAQLFGSDAAVQGIKNEIAALDAKTAAQKKAAEFAAAVKFPHDPAAAHAAAQSADQLIDEESYLKRIELEGKLTNAEYAEEEKRLEHLRANVEGMAAVRRQWVEMMAKDFDSEVKIRTETAEMFARGDKKDLDDSIRAAEEQVKARVDYTETVNRLAEEASLRQITTEETNVSANARLDEQRRASFAVTQYAREAIAIEESNREISQLEELENRKLAVEMKFIEEEKRILLGGQTEQQFVVNADPENLKKLEELNRAIEAAQSQHNERMDQLGRQGQANAIKSTEAMTRSLEGLFQPVNRAMNGMVTGILQGTLTAQEAFRRMGANIVISTIESIAQLGLKWAEHFLVVDLLEKSQTIKSIVNIVTGTTAKEAVLKTAQEAQISIDAGIAFAGGFASVMESVPFPENVALAPTVGASAAAAVFAGGQAERGAIVPQDMLMMTHAKEMILPERISTPLQNVIPAMEKFNMKMNDPTAAGQGGKVPGAPASQTMGDTHIHMNWSALDQKSVADFIHGNRAQFTKALRAAVRNGVRPF